MARPKNPPAPTALLTPDGSRVYTVIFTSPKEGVSSSQIEKILPKNDNSSSAARGSGAIPGSRVRAALKRLRAEKLISSHSFTEPSGQKSNKYTPNLPALASYINSAIPPKLRLSPAEERAFSDYLIEAVPMLDPPRNEYKDKNNNSTIKDADPNKNLREAARPMLLMFPEDYKKTFIPFFVGIISSTARSCLVSGGRKTKIRNSREIEEIYRRRGFPENLRKFAAAMGKMPLSALIKLSNIVDAVFDDAMLSGIAPKIQDKALNRLTLENLEAMTKEDAKVVLGIE